jgi:hypothetical protein
MIRTGRDVHVGDEISILMEGRLPPVNKDPGPFDRREFHARQNIHLLATLRATSLLEKRVARSTLQTRVARLRSHFRELLEGLLRELSLDCRSPESHVAR